MDSKQYSGESAPEQEKSEIGSSLNASVGWGRHLFVVQTEDGGAAFWLEDILHILDDKKYGTTIVLTPYGEGVRTIRTTEEVAALAPRILTALEGLRS